MSQDVLLSYDLSAFIPGNRIPASTHIVTGAKITTSNIGQLHTRSPYGKIELTDVFRTDQNTGLQTPQWYQHTPRSAIYNTSITTHRKKAIGNGKVIAIQDMTTAGRDVVRNQIKITIDGTVTEEFYFDPSLQTIFMQAPVGADIAITYATIARTIKISGISIEPVIIVNSVSDTEYVYQLFTESKTSLNINYLTRIAENRTQEINEITNPERRYTEIDISNVTDVDIIGSYVFGIEPKLTNDYEVKFPRSMNGEEPFKKYAIRSMENVYSKVYMKIPYGVDLRLSWFPEIHGSPYDYNLNGNNIKIDPQELKSNTTNLDLVETAEYINEHTIRVTKTPQWEIDRGGNIHGISVIDTNGNSIQITNITNSTRMITLNRFIGKDDKLYVKYRSKETAHRVMTELNPQKDMQTYNYYWLFYIVDANHLRSGMPSIYHIAIPRFVTNKRIVMTGSAFLGYFERFKEDILAPHSDKFTVPIEDVNCWPISVIYSENPTDEDYLSHIDARIRGGGVTYKAPHTYDWDYWDGEMVDIGGRLQVSIKQSLYNDLVQRFLQWDEETNIDPDPPTRAKILADQWIRKSIEKHLRIGFHYTLKYIED